MFPGYMCEIVSDPGGFLQRKDLIGKLAVVVSCDDPHKSLYKTLVCSAGSVFYFVLYREMLDNKKFTLTNLRLHTYEN